MYGCPHLWDGCQDYIFKSYPGFDLIYTREYLTSPFKAKLVMRDVDKRVKDKLVYLATTKNLPIFERRDVDNLIKKLKKERKRLFKPKCTESYAGDMI